MNKELEVSERDQPKEKRAYLGHVNKRTHHTKGGEIRTRCGPTPPAKPVHPIIDEYLVKYRSPSIQEPHH